MSDEKKPPSDEIPTQPELELDPPASNTEEEPSLSGPSLSPFLDPAGLSPEAPPPPPGEAPPAPTSLDSSETPAPLPDPLPEPRASRFPWLQALTSRVQGLRLRERFERLDLRESLGRFLPQSAARRLPQKIDPAALAQWAEKSANNPELSRYGWVSVVLLSAFFLADLVSLLLGSFIPEPPPIRVARPTAPAAASARTLESYGVIFTRNLFNSRGKIPGDEAGAATPGTDLDGPAQKTTLPLNLIGTIILKDELRSLATIEDKAASMVYPVRVDDEVPGKFRVLNVQPTRVEFINTSSGRKEYVELPEDSSRAPRYSSPPAKSGTPGIEQTANNQFNVSRTAIDAAMADMSKVLTQARAIPHNENGQMVGFKLFSIVPGSIYDQLGLKNGDLLCGVNGEPVNDPAKAMTLVTGIKEMSRLELCVKRDGRTTTYNYDIR